MKEHALAYVNAGFRVLPLYQVVETENGKRICSCWAGERCGSAGKHPLADLAPRGSLDAVSDPAVVATWPDDGYNLGIVMSDTQVAIDIDDSAVARSLLDPELGLRDIATAVKTGRGLHLHIRCAPTSSGLIYAASGHKIGEVRAHNLFVAVPPSTHWSGVQYEWLGASIVDGCATTTTDAWAYAKQLLTAAGVQVADKQRSSATLVPALDGGSIEELDLPFAVPPDEIALAGFLTGSYPLSDGDRSDFLYHLACEAYRVAGKLSYDLDARTVAGVVKKVDGIGYRKFYGRGDSDKRYWELAVRAASDAALDVAKWANGKAALPPAPAPQPSTNGTASANGSVPTVMQTYDWDETLGFLFNGGRSPVRIANFAPVIEEVLNIWQGPHTEPEQQWRVRFGDHSLSLAREDRDLPNSFRRTVQGSLPPTHIVEPGMWDKLFAGMEYYSIGKTVTRPAYGSSGWLPDRDAFLLPGARGAITAEGWDDSVVFEPVGQMPERLYQYGLRVAPGDDITDALSTLYSIAPPSIIVPLMMQVFGSPLTSLGLAQGRAIIHLFGKTGSFKTSIARVALSVFGSFGAESDSIDSWTGTVNALQGTMHRVCDLPLLIDDFKSSIFGRGNKSQVISLIQNYADGTVRTRMDRNQREQAHLIPRCMLLVTGEDLWEGQQSALARTIVLDLERDTVQLSDLTRAQLMAIDGRLGAVGFAWIRWLCEQGKLRLREELNFLRIKLRDEARETAIGAAHPRVVSSITSLLAVDALFRRFIQERAVGFSVQYEELRRRGWREAIVSARTAAEEGEEYSPFEQLKAAINSEIAAESVSLAPRTSDDVWVGNQGAEVIGWADGSHVWINEETTMGWYRSRMSRQGSDVGFTWRALLHEAKSKHQAVRPANATYVAGQYMRATAIPKSEIFS